MVTMTLMVLVCRTYTIALSGLPQNTSWLQQNGKCFLFGGKPWRKPIEWGFYYRYIRKITVAWIQLQAKWRQNTSAFRDRQPIYTVQPNVHYKELDQCAVHLPTHVSTFFVFIFYAHEQEIKAMLRWCHLQTAKEKEFQIIVLCVYTYSPSDKHRETQQHMQQHEQ